MNSLQSELQRLYLPRAAAPDQVRCLVLALAGPPHWRVLGRVWQGVQEELELPAPGIAVAGTDGLQLWFSLAEAVPTARALAFLQGLCRRFLPEVDPARLRLTAGPAARVPALQDSGNWSAFVAADLAPVFEDQPWLDIPPGEEGQAALLRELRPAAPAAFDRAARRLAPPASPAESVAAAPVAAPTDGSTQADPRGFLLGVMNDGNAPLALRIEAAKALLADPHASRARPSASPGA